MSMETIYIDSLMLINFIIDYLLLLLSARVCGTLLHRWRYVLSAVLGAAYSAAVLLPGMSFLSLPPIKIACGMLMSLIAFGREEHIFRCTAVFFCISAAFGGAVYGAGLLSGAPASGASAYIHISMRTLVLAFGVCYAAVRIIFHRSLQKVFRQHVNVQITFKGYSTELIALRDTGNTLCDPLSGAKVMVSDLSSLAPLFSDEVCRCLEEVSPADFVSAVSSMPGMEGVLRLIPYSSVGGCGMLPAFRPDSLTIDGEESSSTLIAISPRPLDPGGEFSALI